MRILWISSGLAFALLTLAIVLRPPAGDMPITPAEPTAPRPLAAEDVAQILTLRDQFGSPADRFGGADASRAAFEEQLLQVAGLDGKKSQTEESADPSVVLRQGAVEIDMLANQAEEAGRYDEADELRSLADKVRRLARAPADGLLSPANADNLRQALIDNGPAPQAQ